MSGTGDDNRAGRASAAAFLRDEAGVTTILGLFVSAGILTAVGVGISAQIAESNRSRMQNTLDSAVLAAADLDQSRDAEAVVSDYFARARMTHALKDTQVTRGLNFRTVYASAAMDLDTVFMADPKNWTISAEAEANETVENVEISMVLDISGSMRFDDRITPLRAAARNFIDITLGGGRHEDTTISIVPYAGQVNPGPELFAALGGVREHDHSSCLVIEDADFDHSGLPVHSTRQVPHFMKWTIAPAYMDWGWCPSDDTAILPLSNDATELKDYIDAMRQHDGTGTQYGMKWGLALLDPTSEDTLDVLFPDTAPVGHVGPWVPPLGTSRPLPWSVDSSRKFIVLMTDGKITDQFEPRHTGFRDPDEDDEDNESGDRDDVDGIDHDALNAEVETNDQGSIGGDTRVVSRSDNVQNFDDICEEAKANGVMIYTIAFEAPSDAADEMRDCASTEAHFYEVGQLEIEAAFASIARQINQLRLTQ